MAINKKVRDGIAEAVGIVGFRSVAKDIKKAQTKNEVVRNVNHLVNNLHKCSKTLTDPITRKSTKNPGYPLCQKWNRKLQEATEFL